MDPPNDACMHVCTYVNIKARGKNLFVSDPLQLGKLCFEQGDYPRLTRIIRQLHQSCQTEEGVDDIKKGTQLLEVYMCVRLACVCVCGCFEL